MCWCTPGYKCFLKIMLSVPALLPNAQAVATTVPPAAGRLVGSTRLAASERRRPAVHKAVIWWHWGSGRHLAV